MVCKGWLKNHQFALSPPVATTDGKAYNVISHILHQKIENPFVSNLIRWILAIGNNGLGSFQIIFHMSRASVERIAIVLSIQVQQDQIKT